MKIVPIDDLVEIIKHGRGGSVREAEAGEEPDFVQERDKLCTGMTGRYRTKGSFSFEISPPMMLRSGVGYVIEIEKV